MAVVIKKYSNRRLYDTEESRYITLDELTEKIRAGSDVAVVDAKTGEDLTQATLTQVILETSAAKLLPVPVLMRLVRMKDDALAEFFGQYVAVTLDLYLQAKHGAQAMRPYFPLASVPFSAGEALARMFSGINPWAGAPPPPPAREPMPSPPPAEERRDSDVQSLRQELEALKKELRRSKPKRKRGGS
ncbi:MAG: polyhydroxyalkanoate synthesis regulator DNA-binding domain-containing protein [Polyangiaceae bacterium]